MPRNEAWSHAPAGMAQFGNVGNGPDRRYASVGGTDHAARGSIFGRSFLRCASWRISRTLDAFLLDIRSSGSLHPDHPLLRIPVGNHSGFFPEADLWISGYGRGDRLYRVREHERVGAPYVHSWNELLCKQL